MPLIAQLSDQNYSIQLTASLLTWVKAGHPQTVSVDSNEEETINLAEMTLITHNWDELVMNCCDN